MRSYQCLLLFLSCSWALPFTSHQGFSPSPAQLREDLQQKWYSNNTGTENNNEDFTPSSAEQVSTGALEAPSDPAAVYSCIGPNADDFPGQDEWLDFDQLWTINEPVITAANEGEEYNDDLKNAILEVASNSKVDARLILSIIMQESSGIVSIHCTESTACGIMQHRGSAGFDASNPKESIKSMIEDGVYGTSSVPGFLTYFNSNSAELSWVNTQLINGNPFAAAHVYNTGHIDSEDLATDRGKSNYYANDVLSRLQGWNGWAAGCEKSRQCDRLGFEDRSC